MSLTFRPASGLVSRRFRLVAVVLMVLLGLLAPGSLSSPADAAVTTPTGQTFPSACLVSFDTSCDGPGEAHLVSAAAGFEVATPEQYAALQRVEDQANAAVRAVHGMSDTLGSHDRVVRYATAELRAALLGRLVQIMQQQNGTRSADEQLVAEWVANTAQHHARNVLQQAQVEFLRWSKVQQGVFRSGPCRYQAPAPYTNEWPGPEGYDRRCSQEGDGGGVILNPIPIYDSATRQPTFEQFVRWGAADADYNALYDGERIGTDGLTGVSALALAAGAVTTDASGPGGAITRTLASSNVVNALRPLSQAGSDVANTDLDTKPGASQRVGSWTDQLPGSKLNEHADLVLRAISNGMLAGYDERTGDTDVRLQRYREDAEAYTPRLNSIAGNTNALQVLLSDLIEATPDTCTSSRYQSSDCPGPGAPGAPQRTPADPLLVTTGYGGTSRTRGTGVPFVTAAVGASYAPRSGSFLQQRKVTLADGWFVVDGVSTPLLELSSIRSTDTNQVQETRYEVADGASVFRTTPRATRLYGRDLAAGACRSDGSSRCVTSSTVPFGDTVASQLGARYETLSLLGNNPPAAATLTPSTQTVQVGQQVTLSASAATDPDGDQVVGESWTAEFDYPCAQSQPAAIDWQCGIGPRGGNGANGGYVLPTGTKVVWNTPGTWEIALTRTDQYGASSTTRQTVQVVAPARNGFGVACDAGCVTSSGEVVLRGFVEAGPTRDRESVSIDWGDGTTSTDIPSSIFVRGEPTQGSNTAPQTLASGTVVTPVSSVAQDFVSRHRYATPRSGGYPITIVFEDAGQGGRTVRYTATAPAPTAPSVRSLTPGPAVEGSPTTLHAVIADDTATDAGTATISWGDGTTSAGVTYLAPSAGGTLSATHTYVDSGSYLVKVTPTDIGGAAGSPQQATQVVAGAPPTVAVLSASAVAEGGTTTLTGTVTDPGVRDGGILSIDWGDGSPALLRSYAPPSDPSSGAFTIDHTYADDGSYTISVTASDTDGLQSAPSTTAARIANEAPRINNASAAPVEEGAVATIHATLTDAGTSDAGTIAVDFGDGTPTQDVPYAAPGASGAAVRLAHSYADDGSYVVHLRPTDAGGATGTTTTLTQIVTGLAPIVTNLSVTTAVEGSSSSLTATVTDAGRADAGTVLLDWGDGSAPTTVAYSAGGARITAEHLYVDDKDGPFRVVVTPTDEDGLRGSAVTSSAVVPNAAPTVTAQVRDAFGDVASTGSTGRPVVVDVPVSIASTFGDPGRNDTLSASIDWGDGVTVRGNAEDLTSATHTWRGPGTYVITVTTTDDSGAVSTSTISVPVRTVAQQVAALAQVVAISADDSGATTAASAALRRAAARLGGTPEDPASASAALRRGQAADAVNALAGAFAELRTAQGDSSRADIEAFQREVVLVARSLAEATVPTTGTTTQRQALSDGNAAMARGDEFSALQQYVAAIPVPAAVPVTPTPTTTAPPSAQAPVSALCLSAAAATRLDLRHLKNAVRRVVDAKRKLTKLREADASDVRLDAVRRTLRRARNAATARLGEAMEGAAVTAAACQPKAKGDY